MDRSIFVGVFLCSLAACSSSSSGGPVAPTDTGAATDTAVDDTAVTEDTAVEDTAVADDTAPAKPKTPTISGIAQMGGALHVSWKLNDTGLTNVELWRKKDAGTYAKAYTLPGTATNQHDSAATAPGTYCYQVYTVRSGVTSDPSPEKCGTP